MAPRKGKKKQGKKVVKELKGTKEISSTGSQTVAKQSVNELVLSLQQWLGDGPSSASFMETKDFWSIISANDSSSTSSRTASLLQSLMRSAHPIPMRTLPDLPNELLSTIFLDAWAASSPKFCLSLSHICKRLRRFAISMPQIWTHVSNYQSPAELKTFLTRSKDEGLTVELFSMRDDDSECAPFLGKVLPSALRWKEFRFEADELRREFFFELGKIPTEKGSQRVQLPALETLHLQCYNPKYEIDEDLEEWGILYFWKAWAMPNLRNLSISNVAEDVFWDCSAFGTELTSLRAQYRSIHWEETDLSNYMDFADKFTSLRNLELTIYKLKDENFHLSNLYFPNLESLQLHFTAEAFHAAYRAIDLFETVMVALRARRLSQLALRVDSPKKRDIVNWLRCIHYDKMTTLCQIYLRFRAPSFRVLLQFPPEDEDEDVESPAQVPSLLAGLEGKPWQDFPKLELSGFPEDLDFFSGPSFRGQKCKEIFEEI